MQKITITLIMMILLNCACARGENESTVDAVTGENAAGEEEAMSILPVRAAVDSISLHAKLGDAMTPDLRLVVCKQAGAAARLARTEAQVGRGKVLELDSNGTLTIEGASLVACKVEGQALTWSTLKEIQIDVASNPAPAKFLVAQAVFLALRGSYGPNDAALNPAMLGHVAMMALAAKEPVSISELVQAMQRADRYFNPCLTDSATAHFACVTSEDGVSHYRAGGKDGSGFAEVKATLIAALSPKQTSGFGLCNAFGNLTPSQVYASTYLGAFQGAYPVWYQHYYDQYYNQYLNQIRLIQAADLA